MKLNLKNRAMFAVLLSAALLNGCAGEMTPMPAKADKFAPQQINFTDDGLSEQLAINPITRTFDQSGLMHITVPVRLTSDLGLTLEYRTTWFDENRNPVEVPTAWIAQPLTPDIFTYLQTNSSSPRARDFQIDFRLAK